ncbi:hypothetical protein ACP4OV_010988 [Aristida adscensionis]
MASNSSLVLKRNTMTAACCYMVLVCLLAGQVLLMATPAVAVSKDVDQILDAPPQMQGPAGPAPAPLVSNLHDPSKFIATCLVCHANGCEPSKCKERCSSCG